MRKRRTGEEFGKYGLIGVMVGCAAGVLGGLWAAQRLGYEDWMVFVVVFFALFGAMDGGIFGYLFDLRKNQSR